MAPSTVYRRQTTRLQMMECIYNTSDSNTGRLATREHADSNAHAPWLIPTSAASTAASAKKPQLHLRTEGQC